MGVFSHELRAWRKEKALALIYRALSDLESGHPRQLLFLELARDADEQATLWALEIRKSGAMPPIAFSPDWPLRIALRLLKTRGPRASLRWLRRREVQGLALYVRPDPRLPDDPETLARPAPLIPDWAAQAALRVGLPAVQDGLVALWLLVMGLAGYGADGTLILLTGIGGMLAGALATASAEALSPAPGEVARPPATAAEMAAPVIGELAALYRRRGMKATEATAEAQKWLEAQSLMEDWVEGEPYAEAEVLTAWQGAAVALFAFAFGGLVPVVPYLLGDVRHPLVLSGLLTMPALMWASGLASKMRGKGGVWGGLQTVVLTGLAGAGVYGLASLLAV